jgi:two-component system chemotaxis response regulator CheY
MLPLDKCVPFREFLMKCLIAEDEDSSREFIQYLLEGYSEIIDTAKNGAEGVRLFEQALKEGRPYDLVCLDILMPLMDGQEALKRMRLLEGESRGPTGKAAVIIMITAVDSIQEIKEAIWQGNCSDYLLKPVSQASLVSLLGKYNLIG